MLQPRFGHSATTLPDGRILVTGGQKRATGTGAALLAEPVGEGAGKDEVYDPSTGLFTLATDADRAAAGTRGPGATLTSAITLASESVLSFDFNDGAFLDDTLLSTEWDANVAALKRSFATVSEINNPLALFNKRIAIIGGVDPQGNVLDAAIFTPARLETDKDDYHPGDFVTLNGSGWKAGEIVDIYVVDNSATSPDWYYDTSVEADANGNFVAEPYLFEVLLQHLGVTFDLTAIGADSGFASTVKFTDGPAISSVSPNAGPIAGGQEVTITSTGFGSGGSGYEVSFDGGVTYVAATFLSVTQVKATTPPHSAGTFGVHIRPKSDNDKWVLALGYTYGAVTQITPAFTASNKTYDGNDSATVTFTGFTPSVGADNVTVSYTSATFSDADAANGKTVTISGLSLGGTDASKYALSTSTVTTTANITQAAATISVAGYTGVYDAAPHGATLVSATGVSGADLSGSVTLSGSFTNVPGGTATWTFTNPNYVSQNGTADIVISPATATINVAGYTGVYDAAAHGATLVSATGVGGADLSASVTLGGETFTNVPGGTATWSFINSNYVPQNGMASIVITRATAMIDVAGYTGVYDAAAHGATLVSATGVGGADLSASVTLGGETFTNVPGGTATWSFSNSNYVAQNGTASIVIDKAIATIVIFPYDVTYDTISHTATASVTGVDAGGAAAGTSLNLSATTHTVAGTYTDAWSFDGGTNYTNQSGSVIDKIRPRAALVNYIGQQTFVTSGASATTAQVTLTASMQDPTGCALKNATVDFIDTATGKVLASGIKVSTVIGSPANTGTANTVVTLSTGNYGSQEYIILVKLTGNYDNTTQAGADKTASVVVSKPAAPSEIIGGGTIANLSSKAGPYGINASGTTTFSVGLKYNKSGTNPQGKISVMIEQANGSTVYIKSNAISSIAVSKITGGNRATIYTKSAISRIDGAGNSTTLDGNVTLRFDVDDVTGTANDVVGITSLSTKDSTLNYSSNWIYDATAKAWKTGTQSIATGTISVQ